MFHILLNKRAKIHSAVSWSIYVIPQYSLKKSCGNFYGVSAGEGLSARFS